jgi:membrane protease YdiL (CAAX protease family)
MSANDPSFEEPTGMPDPNLPSADESISGPPLDSPRTPTADGERLGTPPGWQPELGLPERTIEQKPRRPHPNFWWALLWCVVFLLVTQIPGGIIAVLIAAGLTMVAPDRFPIGNLSDQASILKSEAMSIGLAVGLFIIELTVIGFSLLVIRLVVGRDWTRQLSLRRPSVAHTLLAVASLPALMLLGNVGYDVLRHVLHVPSMSDGLAGTVLFLLAEMLVLGIVLLMAGLLAGWDWTRRLAVRPPNPMDGFIGLASMIALLLLSLGAYEAMRQGLGLSDKSGFALSGMEEMVQLFSKWPWPFAVLVIGLGPGIGEELWCRGFLGRGLLGNYGAVLGILASSFFFGLIHIDPCQGTMAIFMGLWLHFVYLTTRSLWLPMLLHFLNNSLAVLLPRFPQLEAINANPGDIPVSVYVTAGLLLAGVAYALYQSRARLAPQTPEQILLWRPAYESVEYPPADSGAQVIRPSLSPSALALAGGGFFLFLAACVALTTRN